MFFVVFLACQEQSALQGVGYGHEAQNQSGESAFSPPVGLEGIDASSFEFLPEELEVSIEVNAYRQEIELPPMTLLAEFSLLAREHSQAMADGVVSLGHDGFFERYQMASTVALLNAGGENVGMNFAVGDPVANAMSNWLSSEGHLANIEGNYNLTGVGVAENEAGAIFFTQLFFSGQVLE